MTEKPRQEQVFHQPPKNVMRCFKLTLAYDGTAYAGWQLQNDHPTIQGELEHAVQRVTGEQVRVVASGRTDSGVHALGQVASMVSNSRLSPEVLLRALNANLPEDILLRQVEEVRADFHARREAVRKRYRYVIRTSPLRDVFARHYAWQLREPLDVMAMRHAAERLKGTHDFATFQSSGSPRASTVRTVFEIQLAFHEGAPEVLPDASAAVLALPALPGTRIVLEIEADGFLYNMVRNIVGTLVVIGRGEQPETWMRQVMAAGDRRAAGPTAPPHGLFLVRVDYE